MIQRHVVGYYDSETEAIAAIEDLKRRGYSSDEISVLSKHSDNADNVANETGTYATDGAAAGATTGSLLGGLGGVLAGVGALAIPGVGPIIAAGPIVAGITGAAAGAGIGGLAGALIGMGIPQDEATQYNDYFEQGKILLLVDGEYSSTEPPNRPSI